MGLPRELVDGIMRYNDLQTLKNCSLTSKAFYSAARPLIHRRMALGVGSLLRGCSYQRLTIDTVRDQADVFHARYLSAAEERGLLRYGYVREVDLDLRAGNPEDILQLRQLRALETVDTLTIQLLDLHQFLPIFGRCFSQFVPTLRSLALEDARCENAHQLMEFVCRFPHLDDLALIKPCGPGGSGFVNAPPWSEGPRPQQHLPFSGHLVLNGTGPLVQCLLDLPGGVRFHSISTSSCLKDLAKLLGACSSTLKVLRIFCFERGKCSTPTLTHRPTDGSSASSSLNPKASRSFPKPGTRGCAQYQPWMQWDPQTVRIRCGLCGTRHPPPFSSQSSHIYLVTPLFELFPPVVPGTARAQPRLKPR